MGFPSSELSIAKSEKEMLAEAGWKPHNEVTKEWVIITFLLVFFQNEKAQSYEDIINNPSRISNKSKNVEKNAPHQTPHVMFYFCTPIFTCSVKLKFSPKKKKKMWKIKVSVWWK